jgi:hypothetical protein
MTEFKSIIQRDKDMELLPPEKQHETRSPTFHTSNDQTLGSEELEKGTRAALVSGRRGKMTSGKL